MTCRASASVMLSAWSALAPWVTYNWGSGSHVAEAGRLYHDVDHGALLGGLEEGQEPFQAGVVSIHPDHF